MIFDYIPYDLLLNLIEMIDFLDLFPADNSDTVMSSICTRDCD